MVNGFERVLPKEVSPCWEEAQLNTEGCHGAAGILLFRATEAPHHVRLHFPTKLQFGF